MAHSHSLTTREENCALLGHYAAISSNSLPTFRDNLSVPSLGVKNPKEIPLSQYEIKSQRNDVFGKPNLCPLQSKNVGGRGGNHVVGWVRQNDILLMCKETVSVRCTEGWDI